MCEKCGKRNCEFSMVNRYLNVSFTVSSKYREILFMAYAMFLFTYIRLVGPVFSPEIQ